MKKIMISAMMALAMIASPIAEVSAQGQRGGVRDRSKVENGSRGNRRPGNKVSSDNKHNGLRPGGGNQNGNHNGNHNGLRPGGGNHNGNHNGLRPGGGKPGNGRPGVGNRPGNSHGWHPGGPAHVPVLRPGASRPPVMAPPSRIGSKASFLSSGTSGCMAAGPQNQPLVRYTWYNGRDDCKYSY